MSGHRNSYRRTVLLALVAAALAALSGIAFVIWSSAVLHERLIVLLLSLPCFAVATFASAVAVGGLIGLRRDTLEMCGQPYFSNRRRERSAGVFSRLRRRLLTLLPGSPARSRLWPGEWVRVQSLAEISATLDSEGRLDGLPFLPEMVRHCGQRYRVFRRVEKIHDYAGPTGPHLRRMRDAVLLEGLRCGGERHGGCQAACQLIWKEAWLVPGDNVRANAVTQGAARMGAAHMSEAASASRLDTLVQVKSPGGELRYVCQMTELPGATTRLRWLDPRHYLRDLWSGNIRLNLFMIAVALALFNAVQRRCGGATSPHREPTDRKAGAAGALDLQPGEKVRVKAKPAIEQTLDAKSRNRGLWFDVEMHRFCGGEFRVASRVEQIVEEASGRMLSLKNPCIVLEGVSASGEYLGLCPQNELIYWREVWLQRIAAKSAPALDS
jgi:hypothetical protein